LDVVVCYGTNLGGGDIPWLPFFAQVLKQEIKGKIIL